MDIAKLSVELNQKTGVSIILVEQNIDMIRAMAQRCYVMDKGRIVARLQQRCWRIVTRCADIWPCDHGSLSFVCLATPILCSDPRDARNHSPFQNY